MVCWQLAAGLVAASVGRAWWMTAAAAVAGLALVLVTASWYRDLWTFQWAALRLGYVIRDRRFEPRAATCGTLEIGDLTAATVVRATGITVLLEVQANPDQLPHPSALLEQHTDLKAKLLVQRGRCWIALTASRSAGCHRDTELELLLANAARRLVKRLHRQRIAAAALRPDQLTDVLAELTPQQAHEEWNGLRLGTGDYRMYSVPPDLARALPVAVTVTLSSDRDDALVLAPAGAPPPPGGAPLTGRQRFAFTAALP
ncbi:type VII secretion protein EccE [Kribbella catacumbae]|uniref:type VII secretion protein EccE n=1 Tax=Kribbella catacumbae TaxID=460086 RepID=UPI0012F76061|nr:type VII secretion protein EccE [Kribbella catacumbae]